MTDRINGLIVTFDEEIRIDDAERYIELFKAIRHVIDVRPVVSDMEAHIARTQARYEIADRVLDALYPERVERKGKS